MLSRYRDSFSNRVLAPEGELLSFAPPRQLLHALLYLLHPCSRKESSQRKGGPIAAHVLRSSHLCPVGYLSGDDRMGFLPICRRAASMPHHLCPWVLRAVPDKYSGARRGKREKARYYVTSVMNDMYQKIPNDNNQGLTNTANKPMMLAAAMTRITLIL